MLPEDTWLTQLDAIAPEDTAPVARRRGAAAARDDRAAGGRHDRGRHVLARLRRPRARAPERHPVARERPSHLERARRAADRDAERGREEQAAEAAQAVRDVRRVRLAQARERRRESARRVALLADADDRRRRRRRALRGGRLAPARLAEARRGRRSASRPWPQQRSPSPRRRQRSSRPGSTAAHRSRTCSGSRRPCRRARTSRVSCSSLAQARRAERRHAPRDHAAGASEQRGRADSHPDLRDASAAATSRSRGSCASTQALVKVRRRKDQARRAGSSRCRASTLGESVDREVPACSTRRSCCTRTSTTGRSCPSRSPSATEEEPSSRQLVGGREHLLMAKANPRAARERKQKIFVAVGGLMLLATARDPASEAPRRLASRGVGDRPRPRSRGEAATPTPGVAERRRSGRARRHRIDRCSGGPGQLRSFGVFDRKDPFVQQIDDPDDAGDGGGGTGDAAAGRRHGGDGTGDTNEPPSSEDFIDRRSRSAAS